MDEILATRKSYGNVFVTSFNDGTIVPWKLLSTQDFIHYHLLLQAGIYPTAFIEDEIFTKCVLNKILVQNIDAQKAGLVSVVANCILEHSGPQTVEHLNTFLEVKKQESDNILYQIISWICQAFPGYTPDDLLKLNYPDLVLRFCLAEQKLLRAGIITEPFNFHQENQNQQQESIRRPPPKPLPQQKKIQQPENTTKHKQTIITKNDIISSNMQMDSNIQPEDIPAYLKQQEAETQRMAAIYPEYIEQMKRGENVKIYSVEERIAAFEKKSAQYKKEQQKKQAERSIADAEELKQLKEIQAKERKRRARQRKR